MAVVNRLKKWWRAHCEARNARLAEEARESEEMLELIDEAWAEQDRVAAKKRSRPQ